MLQGEHSAILFTFIKPPFVIKIFVLSIFEWLFYTGFTVVYSLHHSGSSSAVKSIFFLLLLYGCVAQSVTCLVTDACLTADSGVASLIPARSHTYVEIDHEIISMLNHSRKVVVSYK